MEEKYKCPICGQFEFEYPNSLEICEVCGWQDDMFQVNNPDYKNGANKVSFNEAKRNYATIGRAKPYFIWSDDEE